MAFAVIFAVALMAAFARPTSPEPCHDAAANSQVGARVGASTHASEKYNNLRLPRGIMPLSYDLYMHVNLSNFKYNGSVDIRLNMHVDTDFVVFHNHGLSLDAVKVTEDGSDTDIAVDTDNSGPIDKYSQYYLQLSRTVRQGTVIILRVEFCGEITEKLNGFYRSSYLDEGGQRHWLATTQFEPTDARSAFPCFDEPAMKAKFTLTLTRDNSLFTLFNTEKVQGSPFDVPGRPDLKTDKFMETKAMSTYLVAIIVSDFKSKETRTTKDGDHTSTKVSVYAAPNKINQTALASDCTSRIVVKYEEFFNIPFPLNKIDVVAVPDFEAGAMENWGLITYRETEILFDPKESDAFTEEAVVITVAHELAHQWFGNLVTLRWWSDLWLNEGFASYVEYIGTQGYHPEWRQMEVFVVDTVQRALAADMVINSHPIQANIADPTEINALFDDISYSKGASMIAMLSDVIGNDTLKAGLNSYLNHFSYSNADTADLWNAFTNATKASGGGSESEVPVRVFMQKWTSQMGYPLLSAKVTGNQLSIAQRHFVLNDNNATSTIWNVPVRYSYKTKSGDITKSQNIFWLKTQAKTLRLDEELVWVKLNTKQAGFYRCNYEPAMWAALTEQLNVDTSVFEPVDRASLLDDAFTLALAGRIDIGIAMNLSSYLARESDSIPWFSGLIQLRTLLTAVTSNQELTKKLKMYAMELLAPKLDELQGWSVAAADDAGIGGGGGSHLEKKLRAQILHLLVKVNHSATVGEGRRRFNAWKNNNTWVPPDFRPTVLRAGVQYGEQSAFEFVWAKYKTATVPSYKEQLLDAACSTQDAGIVDRVLKMSVDTNEVKSQDTTRVIAEIAKNEKGQDPAWEFVKKNWKKVLMKRYHVGSFLIQNLIKGVTSSMNSKQQHQDVTQFFTTAIGTDHKKWPRSVTMALERIASRAAFSENGFDKLSDWLDSRSKPSATT